MALFLLAAGPAGAQEREVELQDLQERIVFLQHRLERLGTTTAGVEGELAVTIAELELQQQRVALDTEERSRAETTLARIVGEVEELELRVGALSAKLRSRLLDLFRLGRQGYLRLVLSIRSRQDLLRGVRQLRFLVRRDAELLVGFLESRDRLDERRAELEASRREVEERLAREASRLEELRRLENRQSALLSRLLAERRNLSAEEARLSEKERKLSVLLSLLEKGAGDSFADRPIQEFEGVLDWPLDGNVVVDFGPRLDPRYGTRVPHNGLDLAPKGSPEVKAVYPGRVLYAAPLEGYGLTAVVLHSGRVFTLYAGLSELRVAPEDVLSLGGLIGFAESGLYFEVRLENRPVDPAGWLR